MAEDEGDLDVRVRRFRLNWLPGTRYIVEPRRTRVAPEALSAYIEYLDAPHSQGYWRLTAKWLKDGQVQKFLVDSLTQKDDNKGPPISRNQIAQRLDTCTDVSALLELFDYCYRKLKNPEGKIDISERLKAPDEMPPIAPENVRDTFQEAFRIFAENIWFEDHDPSINEDNPYFLKTGAIFVHVGPRQGRGRILTRQNEPGVVCFFSPGVRSNCPAKHRTYFCTRRGFASPVFCLFTLDVQTNY
jgi:hypothetical protein